MTAAAATATSEASSSTMRDDSNRGSSGSGSAQGQAMAAHGASTSKMLHGRAMSRMPRTINTVPTWARQHDVSPSQSPDLAPQDRGQDAKTWPRGKDAEQSALHPSSIDLGNGDAAKNHGVPDPRGGATGAKRARRDSDTSSSLSSLHDTSGPGRFWSVSFPRRIRRPSMARTGRTDRRENLDRRRGTLWSDRHRGEDSEDERRARSSSSSDGSGEQRTYETEQRGRYASFGQSYHGALSEAIASLAAGSYMGKSGAGRRNPLSQDEEMKETVAQEERSHERKHRSLDKDADDEEKQLAGAREGTRGGWSHDESHDAEVKKHRGVGGDHSFSRHQPLTPGWQSPWRPESHDAHSIRIGRYRFNNHGDGYFPRTETTKSRASARKRGEKTFVSRGGMWVLLSGEWWRVFLLHNAFVPLLFRFINIAFTTSTLAIAIRIYMILRAQGAEDAVGSSPIVAIIFAPLTLLHVGVQIYLEYFSRPIGLWRVGTKLFYTMIELIFVCLWSAELSLAFDNYFTSTLVCTNFESPYVSNNGEGNVPAGKALDEPSQKPQICRLQSALIGLVFTSLLAYIVVFSVSLFRTFVRVSKH